MSLNPRPLLRAAAVLGCVLPVLALTPPAAADDEPVIPECYEVRVLPDDATLPWLLVCRP